MKQFEILKTNLLTSTAIVLLLVLSLSGAAQVCSSPGNVMYGLANTGEVQPINLTTGAVSPRINAAYPGNPPNFSNGIGYSTLNGKFYYFKRSPDVAPQEFVSWNPVTNSYQALRSCPATSSINVGAVTNDGLGYYCWDQAGVLFYYSIATNNWTTITSDIRTSSGVDVSAVIAANVSGDVAVDGAGTLIFLVGGNTQYALYKLSNPPKTAMATVTVTEMTPLTNTPGGVKFVGIALNVTGELILTTSANPTAKLYRMEDDFTFTYLRNMSAGVGDITSCNFPLSILPVSLKSFEVKETEGNVSLTWEDKLRQGVNGYDIEYSVNGNDWSKVGFVKANYAAGNYSFKHTNPIKGNNYYRIKFTDVSNEVHYSYVKVAELDVRTALSIWPNPVENKMIIRYEGDKGLSGDAWVLDQSGRVMQRQTLSVGLNTVDVSKLTPGSYFIRIKYADGESYMNKIVKK